jgi:hypothetical protein
MSDLTRANTSPENHPQQYCANCNSHLEGPYCAQCGQSTESVLKYFWSVILHLLEDIFSFDSRAKRTLVPLLFRPGFLTNEYIAGKRVKYVPPLRLYLFISIIFFLCLQFATDSADNADFQLVVKYPYPLKKYVSSEITQLETIKSAASPAMTEQQTALLAFFKTHHNLLNDDNQDNQLKKVSIKLLTLKLKKINTPHKFSIQDKQRYSELTRLYQKLHKQQTSKVDGDGLSINLSLDDDNLFDNVEFSYLSTANNKLLNEKITELNTKANKAFKAGAGKLKSQILSVLPQLMFVLLPLFALLLKIIFIFSKRLYMEHLTVALHSHSFIFVVLLLLSALDLITGVALAVNETFGYITDFFSIALLIWVPIYLFLMQKSVYQQNGLFTFIKFVFIGWFYCMLMLLTGFIAFIWGLSAL